MKGMVRFGIAGWSYPDWEGVVYPKPKPKGFEPLGLIAGLVDAVEINSSFYAPVAARNSRKWVGLIQPFPDFRFSAKLWQKFTHEKQGWTEEEVAVWKKGLEPLMESDLLACILVQFPWSFRSNDKNFAKLKKIAESFREFHLVVEVRHSSWQQDWLLDWLKEKEISFANIDQPIFHDSIPATEIITGKIGYARLHGRNQENWFREGAETWERYNYLYDREELSPWSERVKKLSRKTEQLFVIANNHYQGKGLANALELKFLFTEKKQPAPEILIARYPRLKEFCVPIEAQKSLF